MHARVSWAIVVFTAASTDGLDQATVFALTKNDQTKKKKTNSYCERIGPNLLNDFRHDVRLDAI